MKLESVFGLCGTKISFPFSQQKFIHHHHFFFEFFFLYKTGHEYKLGYVASRCNDLSGFFAALCVCTHVKYMYAYKKAPKGFTAANDKVMRYVTNPWYFLRCFSHSRIHTATASSQSYETSRICIFILYII